MRQDEIELLEDKAYEGDIDSAKELFKYYVSIKDEDNISNWKDFLLSADVPSGEVAALENAEVKIIEDKKEDLNEEVKEVIDEHIEDKSLLAMYEAYKNGELNNGTIAQLKESDNIFARLALADRYMLNNYSARVKEYDEVIRELESSKDENASKILEELLYKAGEICENAYDNNNDEEYAKKAFTYYTNACEVISDDDEKAYKYVSKVRDCYKNDLGCVYDKDKEKVLLERICKINGFAGYIELAKSLCANKDYSVDTIDYLQRIANYDGDTSSVKDVGIYKDWARYMEAYISEIEFNGDKQKTRQAANDLAFVISAKQIDELFKGNSEASDRFYEYIMLGGYNGNINSNARELINDKYKLSGKNKDWEDVRELSDIISGKLDNNVPSRLKDQYAEYTSGKFKNKTFSELADIGNENIFAYLAMADRRENASAALEDCERVLQYLSNSYAYPISKTIKQEAKELYNIVTPRAKYYLNKADEENKSVSEDKVDKSTSANNTPSTDNSGIKNNVTSEDKEEKPTLANTSSNTNVKEINSNVAEVKKAKAKINNKLIIGVVAVVAVLIVGIKVFVSLNSGKINLADYIDVSVNGEYNGYATVEVTYDKDGLFNKAKDIDSNVSAYTYIFDDLLNNGSVTYSINKTEGLTNGDEVEISVEADNELINETLKNYGITLKGFKKSITVSGLKDGVALDPFAEDFFNVSTDIKGIHIYYEDSAPYLTMYLKNDADDSDARKNIVYQINGENTAEYLKAGYFNIGDEITINAYLPNDTEGYFLTSSETTFIIPDNWSHVILSTSEIENNFFEKYKSDLTDRMNQYILQYDWIHLDDAYKLNYYINEDAPNVDTFVWDKAYLITLKDGLNYSDYDYASYLILTRSFTYKTSFTDLDNCAEALVFENPYIKDGELSIEQIAEKTKRYTYGNRDNLLDDFYGKIADKYNITEIDISYLN